MVIAIWKRMLLAFALLLGLGFSSAASAAVEISFYSRELGGNNFPHAFVLVKGQLDSGGPAVDMAYGFTAKAISPAILMGSVGGAVLHESPAYIAKSDRQFTMTLTDEQYSAAMATVERWRAKAQPSYNLNRANCVHFVAEIAQSIGLKVPARQELMKKPRSFTLALKEENAQLLASAK